MQKELPVDVLYSALLVTLLVTLNNGFMKISILHVSYGQPQHCTWRKNGQQFSLGQQAWAIWIHLSHDSVPDLFCHELLLPLSSSIISIFLTFLVSFYSQWILNNTHHSNPNPASDIAHGRWVISGIPQQPGQRSAKSLTEIWWVWRSVSVLANSLCIVRSCGWALKVFKE